MKWTIHLHSLARFRMTGATHISTPSNAFKACKGATLCLSHLPFTILWYYRNMLQAIPKLMVLAETSSNSSCFNSTSWYIISHENKDWHVECFTNTCPRRMKPELRHKIQFSNKENMLTHDNLVQRLFIFLNMPFKHYK